jgi:hypothetical protein
VLHLRQDVRHASGQLREIDMAMRVDIHAAIVPDTAWVPILWNRYHRTQENAFIFIIVRLVLESGM